MSKDTKKNILILNYEFPPLGGGAGNATYYLLKEFAKDKETRFTVVTSSTDKFKEEIFAENITVKYLDIGKKGSYHYQTQKDLIVYAVKAYFFCKKLKKRENFDLIHAFFSTPCGVVAMFLKTPYIVSLRGSDVPFYNKRFYNLDRLLFKRLSRRVWKKAEKVIANSKELKELAKKTAPQQEIDVIYNGVDTEEFYPHKKEDNTFTVISTSRLTERKGVSYLIDAFLEFSKEEPSSKLIIAGSGDLKESLESKVKEKKAESIVFLGAVEHSKLKDVYQKGDVFVIPSLNEGMSNSLLEALSSGLAVLSTDTGGAREIVENCGMIIRKKSSEDILEKLRELKNSPQKLQKMKENARTKAQEMSWVGVAVKYKEIYENTTHN